jgi:plastocyanin
VENVLLGAIAFLVIHNPDDPDDVIEADQPGGVHGGSPIETRCFPFPFPVTALPHDLEGLAPIIGEAASKAKTPKQKATKAEYGDESPIEGRTIMRGDLMFELDTDLVQISRVCLPFYVKPPKYAQYLQYYHEMPGVGMCINGRRFMGNTPTLIAGPETKMRFGLAAMNHRTFHTFHLHGHRWVIPGPVGTTPGDIQSSPQIQAVSQFEDTKIFGPANSFSLTINQGSFMGSRFTPDPSRAPGLGEWHMHCHVLDHMMPGGMMGSLLVINGGELAFPQSLPRGVPCPAMEPQEEPPENGEEPPPKLITVLDSSFDPEDCPISVGDTVQWQWAPGVLPHSTTSDTGLWDSGLKTSGTFNHTFTSAGTFPYHCIAHGGPGGIGMSGNVIVT